MTLAKELPSTNENPWPINSLRVQEALLSLFPLITPGESFCVSTPVNLQKRDGGLLEVRLQYQAQSNVYNDNPLVIELSLMRDEAKLSYRGWKAFLYESKGLLHFSSGSDTTKGCEGHGLGASLIKQTNLVIPHLMGHFENLWGAPETTASIVDVAHGHDRDRAKWSSTFARELGYRERMPRTRCFYKTYRER